MRKDILNKRTLLLVLILSTSLFISTASAQETPSSVEVCEEEEGFNVYDILWSDDEDEDLNVTEMEDMETCEAFIEQRDWVWSDYPSLPKDYNDENYDGFEEEAGSESESIVPDGKIPSDGAFVERNPHILDAYVSIGSASPSTTVHTENDESKTYIGENGTAYGITDYRVKDSTHDDSPYEDLDITVTSHKIKTITLYEGDAGSDKIGEENNPSHAWKADFEDLSTDADEISVATEIEVDIDKQYASRCTYRHSHDNSTHSHTRNCIKTNELTRSLTVIDSMNVNVYSNENPTAEVAEMPDGSMELRADVRDDGVWSRIITPNDEAIKSGWHFYSTQQRAWSSFTVEDGGWSWWDRAYPPVKNAQVHTHYETSGIEAVGFSSDIKSIDGKQYNEPNLGENVVVEQTTGSYNAPEDFYFTYPEYEEEGWTVQGLTGNTEDELEITETRTVKETDMEIDVHSVDEEDDTAQISIKLTDEDGNNIHTNRAGLDDPSSEYIEIDGDEYNTQINGEINDITVDVDDVGRVTADYHAANWYTTDREAYDDTSTSQFANTEGGFIESLNDVIMFALYGFGPLLIFIFLLDKTLHLGIWPPWAIWDWLKWE